MQEIPNQYTILTLNELGDGYKAMLKETVHFEHHPLPSPELLECHCTLAKIFHASGMAEAFDEGFDEWEAIKESIHELREDGKTDIGDVLRLAFLCHNGSG